MCVCMYVCIYVFICICIDVCLVALRDKFVRSDCLLFLLMPTGTGYVNRHSTERGKLENGQVGREREREKERKRQAMKT